MVIRRDYERIGREWGGRVFTDMKRRERIAAFARALGVALSSPVVLRIAGCKKTMLADTHTRWMERVIMTLKSQFADEGDENVKTLAYFVLTEANELCKKWGSTECDCRPILEIMEVNAP